MIISEKNIPLFETDEIVEDVNKPVYSDKLRLPKEFQKLTYLDILSLQKKDWLKEQKVEVMKTDKFGVNEFYVVELDYDVELTPELKELFERIRLFFLKKYEKEQHPPHTGKSTKQIIDGLFKYTSMDVQFDKWEKDDKNKEYVYNKSTNGNVVNQWFPEMYDTKIGKMSIMDGFRDKEFFLKKMKEKVLFDSMYHWVWRKRDKEKGTIKLYIPTELSKYNMKIFPGIYEVFRLGWSQPQVNFPTYVSKFLWYWGLFRLNYSLWKDEDEVVLLDTSSGWGSRFIGLLSVMSCYRDWFKDKKVVLITVDPNPIIGERLNMIFNFWNKHIFDLTNLFEFIYINDGSEFLDNYDVFDKYREKVVFGFTSTPYFHKEKYPGGSKQSYKMYKEYDDWMNGFLYKTLENISHLLKPNGVYLLNIENVKEGSKVFPIQDDLHRDLGNKVNSLKIEDVKYLRLSIMRGNNLNRKDKVNSQMIEVNGKRYKQERIFQLRKIN